MKRPDSCTAFICWKNKVLLFLRDDKDDIPAPNCWQLPGGGIDPGESPEACIKRELLEEVSHVPRILKFFTKVKTPDKTKVKTPDKTNVYIYYSFIDDDEAERFKKGEFEGQDASFFTLGQMEKLTLTPSLKFYLERNKKALSEEILKKSFSGFKLG